MGSTSCIIYSKNVSVKLRALEEGRDTMNQTYLIVVQE